MTAQLAISSPCLMNHVPYTLLMSITGRAEVPSSTKVVEFLLFHYIACYVTPCNMPCYHKPCTCLGDHSGKSTTSGHCPLENSEA